jgi:hypothetical protein
MVVWLNRLVPWFVDWMMARKVYQLYRDEIEARNKNEPTAPLVSSPTG